MTCDEPERFKGGGHVKNGVLHSLQRQIEMGQDPEGRESDEV